MQDDRDDKKTFDIEEDWFGCIIGLSIILIIIIVM